MSDHRPTLRSVKDGPQPRTYTKVIVNLPTSIADLIVLEANVRGVTVSDMILTGLSNFLKLADLEKKGSKILVESPDGNLEQAHLSGVTTGAK